MRKFLAGDSIQSSKDLFEKIINIYFLFLSELNKTRSLAANISSSDQNSKQQVSAQHVLFFDSKYLKLWCQMSFGQTRNEEQIREEINNMSQYETILIPYFPSLEKQQSPEDSKNGEEENFDDYYSPFLI